MTTNGLSAINGLSLSNGLMTTTPGRTTVSYLVRCALPAGRSIVKTDASGTSYTFTGKIGLAPQWETGACDTTCQQLVSACMMAHVNTTGQHINLWMVASAPSVGWGYTYDYPYQEGSFFGNIFVSPPQAFYCNGSDFDSGVVPGRLGATQVGAPYTNPLGGSALCRSACTPSPLLATHLDIASTYPAVIGRMAPDGFTSCPSYSNVLTVYRNFDAVTDYKICNRNSGLCLDVVGKSTSVGALIDQTAYASQSNQRFGFNAMSNVSGNYSFPTYTIVNRNSAKILALPKLSATTDLQIQQSTFTQANYQQWMIRPVGGGVYSICNWGSSAVGGMCLAVKGASTAAGAAVVQQSYTAAVNQQWTISLAN